MTVGADPRALAAELDRLREENARLRHERGSFSADLASALDDAPVLLFLFDEEGRFLEFRSGRPQELYAPPETFIGRRIDEVLPGPVAGRFLEVMARVRTTARAEVFEYELDLPPGRRHFDCQVIPLRDRRRVATLITDVSERRRRDELLRDTQERLRIAFEHAPIGIALAGLDGTLLDVNAALCTMLGYTRAELLGRRAPDITHPDDRLPERRLVDRLIAGEATTLRTSKRYLHASGDVVWARLSLSAVRGHDGAASHVIGQVEDVTEERRLSEQLLQSQKLEAIGRLAGGVAHDFNNLLTVMFGCVEALESELPAGSEHLQELRAAADRARDLTRQLLAFARRQVTAPVVVDPGAFLAEVEKLLARVLGEDVRLALSLGARGCIRVDPGQLQQVVLNLAVNARDAMPDGGRLVIETADVDLDAEFAARHAEAEPGAYVLVSVSDTGVGMTEEVRGRVFEPFFTTKPTGQGTGLGLATVYGIVKQSRGHVFVRSEPGRGTTFDIYLPRVDAAPDPRSLPGAAARGGAERILVVEDDPFVRSVTVRSLRRAGYDVVEAASGAEALAVSGPVALLVTDVIMPDMRGPEVARLFAARQPGLRVLYVSGYTEDTIVHEGVLEPGIEFLGKPFTAPELLVRVRALLDR